MDHARTDASGGSPQTPSCAPAWIPWAVGGIVVLLLMLRDYRLSDGLVVDRSVVWGWDFINMWTGGRLVRASRTDILYDLSA